MHVILADSIDGGILMILFIGGGLATSVLALIALVPAWQGNRTAAMALAAPAFVAWIVATLCFVWWYLHYGLNDPNYGSPNYGLKDYLAVWVILAGPPFASSLLAVICLWFRRARAKQNING